MKCLPELFLILKKILVVKNINLSHSPTLKAIKSIKVVIVDQLWQQMRGTHQITEMEEIKSLYNMKGEQRNRES